MVEGIVQKVVHLVANQVSKQDWIGDVQRQNSCERQIEENVEGNVTGHYREDQAVTVHWKAVVDAMDGVVECEHEVRLWHVFHPVVLSMEEEPMKCIFSKGPD